MIERNPKQKNREESNVYEIVKVSRYYKGRCTITHEKTVKPNATKEDIEKIVNASPEKYEGERAEFWDDMETMGCSSYHGYMFFERN